MKLPLLLSQFLYATRKLDLPGLGSFTMDPNAVVPEPSERGNQAPVSGISFKNAVINQPDDALVNFIKEHTGKMKPLAAADLDFFLTTGKQLLNIGKPFYLEGIGTLLKNNEGKLVFTPGEYSSYKLEDAEKDKKKTGTSFEEPPREYEPKSNNVRQALLLIGLIGGLVAIGWGGYYLYKRNTYSEPSENTVAARQDSPAQQQADTNKTVQGNAGTTASSSQPVSTTPATTTPPAQPPAVSPRPADSLRPAPAPAVIPVAGPGEALYKFVILETTKKGRALRRYNQLIGYQLNIKMDQKDSSYFKLYFPIVAAARDTMHIRDSLMDVYAAQVTIER